MNDTQDHTQERTKQMKRMKMKNPNAPPCAMIQDGEDLFIEFKGVRIAKRGQPGTPQAKTWISLWPGYRVSDLSRDELVVEFHEESTH